MGKQIFDRTRKILGTSILALLVMSMMVAVVSAQENCGWTCDDPITDQHYYKNCKWKWICDSDNGSWCWSDAEGKNVWKCGSYHRECVCDDYGDTGTSCNNWKWACCS